MALRMSWLLAVLLYSAAASDGINSCEGSPSYSSSLLQKPLAAESWKDTRSSSALTWSKLRFAEMVAAGTIVVFMLILLGALLVKYLLAEVRRYEESRTPDMPGWYYDSKMLVRVGGLSLLYWLLTGVASFTCVIEFGDLGTKGRHLTICEAVYLCAQIVTTVGYGDLTPAHPAGEVFVMIYMVVAVGLLAGLLTQMLEVFDVDQVWAQFYAFIPVWFAKHPPQEETEAERHKSPKQKEEDLHTERQDLLRQALISVLAHIAVGCFFFSLYPGEDKSWRQVVYMSTVTFTTIGFGVYHPKTQAGYLFGAFWMISGVSSMANLIFSIRKYIFQSRKLEADLRKSRMIEALDMNKDGHVDKIEFLRIMLVSNGACSANDIDDVLATFDELDTEGNGKLSVAAAFERDNPSTSNSSKSQIE